jgi:hypothetical protein
MKPDAALVVGLVCLALAARLVPLTFSPLPFSVDGFALSRIASDIVARGSWAIDPASVNSYNQKLGGFSLLWAVTAEIGGLSPLVHAQLYVPLITCLTVLPGYLFGAKVTGRRLGGFAAGLFLALFGSFLNVTSGVAKESIALLVFPLAVLLFHERADPRKRALAVVLLIFLPFLHSLTTFLTLGMIAALVVLGQRRALFRGRFSWRALALDVVTGPALAAAALGYYLAVDLPFLSEFLAPAAFALFLALVLLLTVLIGPAFRPQKSRFGHGKIASAAKAALPPAIGFALLLGNASTSLFVGTTATSPAFLQGMPSLLVLAALCIGGFVLVRRTTNRMGDLVVAMLVAPIALILFGFFRGLDPLGQVLVYRAFDFLDYALAVLVAVAFVAAWSVLQMRPLRVLIAVGFLAALLATTPMAWNTPAVLGVQNVTTSEEFHALALIASLGAHRIATDERLADVASWWFGLSADASFPLKLRDNASLGGADYALVLERWSTAGAQIHPAPNLILAPRTIASFLAANRVMYAGGPAGDRVFVVQVLG